MLRGQVTFATGKGSRACQEDRFLVLGPKVRGNFSGWLLAVMDGHNGSEACDFCLENLINIFLEVSDDGRIRIDENVLRKVVRLLAEKTKDMGSGSTLSLVYVDEVASVVRVAILGDSPVIIKDSNGNTVVSPEHNVRTNQAERNAAKKRGAVYDRGYIRLEYLGSGQMIQLSRTLGDCGLSDIVSREPETHSVKLGKDSFVLVASDGLLDPGHKNGQSLLESVVAQIEEGSTVGDLVQGAVDVRKTNDNATAVLWRVSANLLKEK